MTALVALAAGLTVIALGWPNVGPRADAHRGLTQTTTRSRRTMPVVWPMRRGHGRTFGGVAVVVVLTLVVGPTLPLLGVGGALGVWRWHRRSIRARHELALRAALPDAIDLLSAVLGAGGSVRQAFVVLENQGPEVLRPALRRADDHRSAGVAFAAWSETFLAEAGDDYRPLVRALLATERDGAPIATLLERLAQESRRTRADERDVAAKRLPLLLLGPLALCSLPAVIVGSVIPLVLVALGAVDLG